MRGCHTPPRVIVQLQPQLAPHQQPTRRPDPVLEDPLVRGGQGCRAHWAGSNADGLKQAAGGEAEAEPALRGAERKCEDPHSVEV